ncbi:MAG: MBL fold metallo-hydrolase [bacterium]|nr:MBL fold metallo-hydrolase [bacterium]
MNQELLHLIDLDQNLPGQRRFISCWVGSLNGQYFLVDPGPPSTGDFLVSSLESLNLPRVDVVLLTHIHLDHAGATSHILERWPAARVFCQSKGRPHLVDPGKLWQGSLSVLGHKAEVYGEPQPVPENSLMNEPELAENGMQVIKTPGHAPHHVSFVCGENLFLGESAGTFSNLHKPAGSVDYYLRPATPPRFFPDIADQSLKAMLDWTPFPERLCFAHHGSFEGNGRVLLEQARHQLKLWIKVVGQTLKEAGINPAHDSAVQNHAPELIQILRDADPFFARGSELPKDIQQRETDFTNQTLRGMAGFLARNN